MSLVPDLREAASALARVAATDPSTLVDFLDDLRAELSAQKRTSRPFRLACAALACAVGEAEAAYGRTVDAGDG